MLLHLTRGEGKFLAAPVAGGSSALSTIVKSNGYTIVPPHTTKAKGSKVEVSLFGKLEFSAFS